MSATTSQVGDVAAGAGFGFAFVSLGLYGYAAADEAEHGPMVGRKKAVVCKLMKFCLAAEITSFLVMLGATVVGSVRDSRKS
jgi:hypothetical protein